MFVWWLKWYGHVIRTDENRVEKRVMMVMMMMMDVYGRRTKGRPERRLMDSVSVDSREKGLSGEEKENRNVWRQLVTYIDPIQKYE